jgi:pepF/M3 family oligoendopeptidase
MKQWNLDHLYLGFDDPLFASDLQRLDQLIAEANRFGEKQLADHDGKESKLVEYLKNEIALSNQFLRLFCFAALRESVNSTDSLAVKYLNTLQMKMTDLTKTETLFTKWVAGYENLDASIANDPFLKEHAFHLHEIVDNTKYILDDKTEELLAKLRQSGSDAWSRLQSLLTSTLSVEYEGKQITLSQVRNLAYDADPIVRKKAFEAEIKSYKAIEKPVSFALNGIKGEVNTVSALRGFPSALDETLKKSRMKRETLETMFGVCREYLPTFRCYLKQKAKLLGHENGLPFYDLFAPMGKSTSVYTIPEANAYVLKNFKTFNDRLYKMAKKAFDENWIDYTPRDGKVGGAFCESIHPIQESRVLTNFTGMFGDIITIAHELGHAYHAECIFPESVLNSDYTMPVAETASTFCETIVNKAALRDAKTKDEKIALLESSIQDYTQVIVDILSRFIFEQSVFEGRKTTVFDENELKALMLDAQKLTYGDGLDPDFLHPYMWLCKGHYYRGSLSFYNFPYAFGLLFAKGLYAQYQKDKAGFVAKYDQLLAATGKATVEDTARMAGIDVTKREFWVGSLELLKADIDMFIELTK